MTVRFRTQVTLVSAAFGAATCLVGAVQQPAAPAESAPLSAQIPVDPQITVGRLPNGLRYYVRANKRPENRAELRLVVNVGSIVEDDDQLGLAHFVEHMAFNGTKNFPKQAIVNFMESIGMRFGPSVNAFTSFDETVFMLQVPLDKPDVLDRAFLVLEDWAHNVAFDPAEIDKERGVIMEEWRLGRGAGARMQDKQFPILLQGSRYAQRLPIGKPEILQNFKHERLTKFYTDWYRPDLMAVIAVGDFEKPAVEGLIKTHFARIPAAATRRPRPDYDVPDHPGTLYAIATDKEATSTNITTYNKLPLRDPTTLGAYRQQIVESLYASMLNTRFAELAQKPDPPFIAAGGGRGSFVRTKEAAVLNALVKDDGLERGLDALFTESERVARFGFTSSELDRQKRNILRSYEQMLAEKDTQQSAGFAAEFARNFTTNEAIPGIAYEQALAARFVPEITLDEINKLSKEFTGDRSRVVVVSAPDKPGLVVPDGAKLAAVMKAAASKTVTAYEDTLGTQPLLDPIPPPAPNAVVKVATRDAFGITEWDLANGVKVVLKPTTFKEDEIVFRAFSPGGTSLASDEDFIPASTAVQVVMAGGVGSFSAIDLRKVLAGKLASAQPFISTLEEGVTGSASRKDLETMFQLIYLDFTQPRADPTMFGVVTARQKALLANQRALPEYAFFEILNGTLTQNHLRTRFMTPELIDQMNLQKSFAFYQDRFADASDFTFVFVGSFDPAAIRPLVERYLGALPALKRKETWKDVGITAPKGVIEKRVDKGIEPKSSASVVFTGPFVYDQTQRVAIRAMTQVLQTRLREILREDLGGTYSVSVSAGYDRIPKPEYSVSIDFGSGPERTDALLKIVFQEIDQLKSAGPTEKVVADVREGLLRDFETNSKLNGYLLSQIAGKYQLGEAPETLLLVPDYYKKLTPAAIQQAARTYLNTGNYVKVTLFPEKR